MKYKLKLITLLLSLISLIVSCKKTEKQNNNCSCPSSTSPEALFQISNLTSNGFFVFNKYFTIQNNILMTDSCISKANQPSYGGFIIYPGNGTNLVHVDSVKVNSITCKRLDAFNNFMDTTKYCFASSRHCEMYGDTLINNYFADINYNDNTPTPIYNDWHLLPDSIKVGKDSVINIGSRSNLLETQFKLVFTPQFSGPVIYSTELKNSETSITIPNSSLIGVSLGNIYMVINVRNWSTIVLKKQKFSFVSDNRYVKKIKLYN